MKPSEDKVDKRSLSKCNRRDFNLLKCLSSSCSYARAQIFICNRFLSLLLSQAKLIDSTLWRPVFPIESKFDKFVHIIQMDRCLAVNQPQCLFAHLSVHSEDVELASKRKIEAARITHSSGKIDTRNISGAGYLHFCFRDGIHIDIVTDFSWKSKELGHRIRDIAMSQLPNGLASILKREKAGAYLCNGHCCQCFIFGQLQGQMESEFRINIRCEAVLTDAVFAFKDDSVPTTGDFLGS